MMSWPALGADGSAGRTNPNTGRFPDSSMVDFRFLLDAPAGRRGFLGISGSGRFAWPDGTRARFWGINVSSKSLYVPHAVIDQVCDVLARAGCNMLRLEAADSVGGLTEVEGNPGSRALNPERLDSLDYWIAAARRRGIYLYLNLLDFRQFRDADGVENAARLGRAARPYAIFDRRLIELQKEFAVQLLSHRNPYSRLRLCEDPAVALVEVCNENGFFLRRGGLDTLVEPYAGRLRALWNTWLADQYGSRDHLAEAWGEVSGVPTLQPNEDPVAGTVLLPFFAPAAGPTTPMVVDPRRAPTRLSDAVRFLSGVQRAYFAEMKQALVTLGVRVPITGSVSTECPADLASTADLDFTAGNCYADHPAFAGADWQGALFVNDNNPLRAASTYQLAPWMGALRWNGRPVVVREWATVWPNSHRAIAIPEMAAYASLQDVDAVLLFGYQTVWRPDELSDFDHQADPTVWGLYGVGALAFLRGDIKAAEQVATLQYTPADLFVWPGDLAGSHRLAWLARINSVGPGDALLTSMPDAPTIPASMATVEARDALVRSGVAADLLLLADPALRASTGEMTRDCAAGRLTVRTDRFVAVCGEFPEGKAVRIGDWSLVTGSPFGAFVAVSLDGRPLVQSQRILLKMVTVAANTGQKLDTAPPGAPGKWQLTSWGKPPVVTGGGVSDVPLRVSLGKRELVSLALRNGTWEVLVEDGRAALVCDTGGIRGTLMGTTIVTTADVAVAGGLAMRAGR